MASGRRGRLEVEHPAEGDYLDRAGCPSVANGCLQIIPGSHKTMIPEKGDLLSPEERAIHAPDEKRLYLEMEMGEVVLLHNWTLHRSEVNTTNRPRRAFSVCYVDAGTYRTNTGLAFSENLS